MKTSRVAPLPLLLLVAACAARPSGPPPLEPVGRYEFSTRGRWSTAQRHHGDHRNARRLQRLDPG